MKVCSKCKEEKHDEDFGSRGSKKQPWCKSCNTAYNKEHYQKNKEAYKRDNGQRRWIARQKALEFLIEAAKEGCADCGEKDYRCLQFDHNDPSEKSFGIANAASNGTSLKRIAEEIKKCTIRCANCHAKRTSEQFNWYQNVTHYRPLTGLRA